MYMYIESDSLTKRPGSFWVIEYTYRDTKSPLSCRRRTHKCPGCRDATTTSALRAVTFLQQLNTDMRNDIYAIIIDCLSSRNNQLLIPPGVLTVDEW